MYDFELTVSDLYLSLVDVFLTKCHLASTSDNCFSLCFSEGDKQFIPSLEDNLFVTDEH